MRRRFVVLLPLLAGCGQQNGFHLVPTPPTDVPAKLLTQPASGNLCPHGGGEYQARLAIDANGVVTHAEVLSGPAIGRADYLPEVLQYRFNPELHDGEPVATTITIATNVDCF